MPEPGLIGESLRLMVIGMGIVFCFLLLLVVLLRAMSMLAERLAPPITEVSGDVQSRAAVTTREDLIAVISAAIARYRSNH